MLLLAVVAELISYIAIGSIRTYNHQLQDMQRVARAAILGEQVNSLMLAVTLDLRNLATARDQADGAKYASSIEKILNLIKQKMARWTALGARQTGTRWIAPTPDVDEFIKSHSEAARPKRHLAHNNRAAAASVRRPHCASAEHWRRSRSTTPWWSGNWRNRAALLRVRAG